jgi:hypothetical protein
VPPLQPRLSPSSPLLQPSKAKCLFVGSSSLRRTNKRNCIRRASCLINILVSLILELRKSKQPTNPQLTSGYFVFFWSRDKWRASNSNNNKFRLFIHCVMYYYYVIVNSIHWFLLSLIFIYIYEIQMCVNKWHDATPPLTPISIPFEVIQNWKHAVSCRSRLV